MVKTGLREIAYAFEQPDTILLLLQQFVDSPSSQATSRFDGARILIIDTRRDGVQRLARFLFVNGYSSKVAASALDAFTLFLQGAVLPLVILLSQESVPERLFLQRLAQQMHQKYGREPVLVRLPSAMFNTPVSQITAPLSPLSPAAPREFSPSITGPLSPAHLSPRTTGPLSSAQASLSGNVQMPGMAKKISLEGQNFGRYQILSLLGEGHLSAVYRAYDRMREQDIALKAMQTNSVPYFQMEGSQEEKSFFQQEKELLDTLNHPHILSVSNCGKTYVSGSSFIYKTMPCCEYGSLASWLVSRAGMQHYAPRDVSAVVVQLADALQHAHERRIIYQNFKLSNLLIVNEQDELPQLQLKLGDFAVCQNGQFPYKTPDNFHFMAPEQWQNRSVAASDQYGLAVVAYRLLAGRFPFLGETEQVQQRMHMGTLPQPLSRFNSEVSPALDMVMLRAMAKRPQERFASVREFARDFQDACR